MSVVYREEPCKSALNRVKGMPFEWTLNPYMGCAHRCTFCYVRGFERRAERPSGEEYGRSLRVKTNIPGVLARELRRPSWKGASVAIGTATDPYQPAEGSYRLTRGCLEVLTARRNPFSIITRGPLILRDLDLLAKASAITEVSVSVSIPTLDREVWRKTEPGTAPPHQRLRAVRLLNEAGVSAGVAVAPILPGLSDGPEQLEALVRAAREAGAAALWCRPLSLTPGTREHFLGALRRDFPHLTARYDDLYSRGAYLRSQDAEPLTAQVSELRERYEIRDRHRRPPRAPREQQLALALG